MPNFINTVLAAACANIATWLLYQGFIKSYWGKNAVEEITRFFNKHCKHYQKMKDNGDLTK